eukprot:3841381-Pyramimonas_sp.AAC.1
MAPVLPIQCLRLAHPPRAGDAVGIATCRYGPEVLASGHAPSRSQADYAPVTVTVTTAIPRSPRALPPAKLLC